MRSRKQVGGALEDAAALMGRHGAPGRIGVAGGRQRPVQIRRRRQRQLAQHLFGCRIDHRNVLAVAAGDPFPANEQIQFGVSGAQHGGLQKRGTHPNKPPSRPTTTALTVIYLRARPGAAAGANLLWLKAFHIVFLVTWFAGLFYLPRLFVYHVSAQDPISRARFVVMERRLFVMTTVGAVLTRAVRIPAAAVVARLHAARLAARQTDTGGCGHLLPGLVHAVDAALRDDRNTHSERWYRLFNEVPGLLLIAIVILAVVKPSLG